jgi:hypothetical protein
MRKIALIVFLMALWLWGFPRRINGQILKNMPNLLWADL